jgi:hypothetical protein
MNNVTLNISPPWESSQIVGKKKQPKELNYYEWDTFGHCPSMKIGQIIEKNDLSKTSTMKMILLYSSPHSERQQINREKTTDILWWTMYVNNYPASTILDLNIIHQCQFLSIMSSYPLTTFWNFLHASFMNVSRWRFCRILSTITDLLIKRIN